MHIIAGPGPRAVSPAKANSGEAGGRRWAGMRNGGAAEGEAEPQNCRRPSANWHNARQRQRDPLRLPIESTLHLKW